MIVSGTHDTIEKIHSMEDCECIFALRISNSLYKWTYAFTIHFSIYLIYKSWSSGHAKASVIQRFTSIKTYQTMDNSSQHSIFFMN